MNIRKLLIINQNVYLVIELRFRTFISMGRNKRTVNNNMETRTEMEKYEDRKIKIDGKVTNFRKNQLTHVTRN